jgi:hypothetical protein
VHVCGVGGACAGRARLFFFCFFYVRTRRVVMDLRAEFDDQNRSYIPNETERNLQ